jgi:beta-glucanase (GH16 family)
MIKMTTINKVLENVKTVKGVELSEFNNAIIEAFSDYEYEGNSEILINQSHNNGYDMIAYANVRTSPEVLMNVKITNDTITVVDAWLN